MIPIVDQIIYHVKKKKSTSVDCSTDSDVNQHGLLHGFDCEIHFTLHMKILNTCEKCWGKTLVKFSSDLRGLRTSILAARYTPLQHYQQNKRTTLFRKIM